MGNEVIAVTDTIIPEQVRYIEAATTGQVNLGTSTTTIAGNDLDVLAVLVELLMLVILLLTERCEIGAINVVLDDLTQLLLTQIQVVIHLTQLLKSIVLLQKLQVLLLLRLLQQTWLQLKAQQLVLTQLP